MRLQALKKTENSLRRYAQNQKYEFRSVGFKKKSRKIVPMPIYETGIAHVLFQRRRLSATHSHHRRVTRSLGAKNQKISSQKVLGPPRRVPRRSIPAMSDRGIRVRYLPTYLPTYLVVGRMGRKKKHYHIMSVARCFGCRLGTCTYGGAVRPDFVKRARRPGSRLWRRRVSTSLEWRPEVRASRTVGRRRPRWNSEGARLG